MDPSTFKCPRCDFAHANLNSLRIHWQKRHKGTALELRLVLFHDNKRPVCECGCGAETAFDGLMLGFTRFINGHNNRVHNNWGHNPEVVKKSHDVQRGMRARGEFAPNPYKGLTKETDERLRLRGERVAKAWNGAKRETYSDMMKGMWANGTITPLTGSAHSQWKGGTSALQPLTRSRVFNAWTYPKLKAANFTCAQCGSKRDLEVHHDQERFAAILQKAVVALGEVVDDNFAQKAAIAEWVADYHVAHDVSGIVLCEDCHEGEHAGDTYRHEAN